VPVTLEEGNRFQRFKILKLHNHVRPPVKASLDKFIHELGFRVYGLVQTCSVQPGLVQPCFTFVKASLDKFIHEMKVFIAGQSSLPSSEIVGVLE